jgi:DNA-binding MarR family transcriptional regulator
MTKAHLLELLAGMESVCAEDAAGLLGVTRPTASMALLRLARQGLATRWLEDSDPRIRYAISERGRDRLAYLVDGETKKWPVERGHPTGGEDMKRAQTHSGDFYCPKCFIQFELVDEESLRCDKCKGPLAEGMLDDVWDDDDDDEDE